VSRWVWNGLFSMDVVEGWDVRESPGLIEIVPPEPVGAIHISVLSRARDGHVQIGEASELVKNFAQKQGCNQPRVTESDACVARGQFRTGSDTDWYYWDVEARVWAKRGLVCSYCHDGRSETHRKAALAMFASIQTEAAT
jgi:hypothetical protein